MKQITAMLLCLMMASFSWIGMAEMALYCQYDDGSRIELEEGSTIPSDGELNIAMEGLDEALIYRLQFSGETRDGTPFVDHRGTGAENSALHYFTLTHKAGVYGPFALEIQNSDGQQHIVNFSVDVQPDKSKDWLEYGILNEAGYAEMPPFLPVVKGDPEAAEMQAEDFAILEPGNGAILSGSENCELGLLFDLRKPNLEFEWRVYDLQTNDTITGFTERLPFESTFYAPVEARMLEYGREYGIEVNAGKQTVHSTFSLVEETTGMTANIKETAEARQALTEKWIEEDMAKEHGSTQLVESTDDVVKELLNTLSERYAFDQIKPDAGVKQDAQLYSRLVEKFNGEYASYVTGMVQMDGLFVYKRDADEDGILQSFALAWDAETIANLEPNMNSADEHMRHNLGNCASVSTVNMASGEQSAQPIHYGYIEELQAQHNADAMVSAIAYMPVLTTQGKCAADILIMREQIRGKTYDGNWYLFVRFMDPQADGSIVYEWNSADQEFVEEMLQYMDKSRLEWAVGMNAENWQTGEWVKTEPAEQERKVRIRKSGDVNVRKESNSDSARVGSAKAGAEYPCLGIEDNGWFRIQLENGDIGFISGKMATLME